MAISNFKFGETYAGLFVKHCNIQLVSVILCYFVFFNNNHVFLFNMFSGDLKRISTNCNLLLFSLQCRFLRIMLRNDLKSCIS